MELQNNQFIIFLDFDGLLNSIDFCKNRWDKTGGLESMLDPRAIQWLNEFLGNDGLVVISSTWRIGKTIDELQTILNNAGFTGKIIGSTPLLNTDRGVEIKRWLKDNDLYDYFERYVIFDDDSDMLLEQREHYFNVDNYFGVSPNTFYKAKRFLEKTKNRK